MLCCFITTCAATFEALFFVDVFLVLLFIGDICRTRRSSGGVVEELKKKERPAGAACGAVKTCFCGTIAVFLVCRPPGTSRTCYSGDIDWLWILCVSDEILHIMQSKSALLCFFADCLLVCQYGLKDALKCIVVVFIVSICNLF